MHADGDTCHINGNAQAPKVEVDVLIVGTGPAGASLACFLGSHGIKGLLITAASSTSNMPRAHVTNPATLESLRDIGIVDECINSSTSYEQIPLVRYSSTFFEGEYVRAKLLGQGSDRNGDFLTASAERHIDLPQSNFEPILIKYATQHGFRLRYDTKFLHCSEEDDSGSVIVTCQDLITSSQYDIRCRYLIGADGGRSMVAKQIDLPFTELPSQGPALSVLIETIGMEKAAHLGLGAVITGVFKPEINGPPWGLIALFRPVRLWKEWLVILLPAPGFERFDVTDVEIKNRLDELIGDDSIQVSIKDVSAWRVNEASADRYSKGNIFCMGDAVHRHPPHNGLGSNTAIADAYNLAWKLAYVIKGLAPGSLLETYSNEREPVGAQVVNRANASLRLDFGLLSALGMVFPDAAERMAWLEQLKAAGQDGKNKRQAVEEAWKTTCSYQFNAIGAEMNQHYGYIPGTETPSIGRVAVYAADEMEGPPPNDRGDADLYYHQHTYPGKRLPHAPLTVSGDGYATSTQRIAGRGLFTLFTGPGCKDVWTRAVAGAKKILTEQTDRTTGAANAGAVQVKVVSIGYGCDYEDTWFEWSARRGVGEEGCVLVRPDRFVCWRSQGLLGPHGAEGDGTEEGKKLAVVLREVLTF